MRLLGNSCGRLLLFATLAGFALTRTPALATTLLTAAARELGQPDFVSSAPNTPDLNSIAHARGVGIDRSITPNRLYIADTDNNRVLVYTNVTAVADGGSANLVIGQSGFVSNGCNPTGLSGSSLCAPDALAVDGSGRVYVVDTGNNRVLVYNPPSANGAAAIAVFGQGGNFTSGACNLGGGPGANTLCTPAGVSLDSHGNVYIADFGNHRVLEYNTPFQVTAVAGSGDTTADLEFGQGKGSGNDFTDNSCNFGGLSKTSLCNPEEVAADSAGNLYIADYVNHRVLEYHESSNPPANTTANLEFGQGNGSGNDFIDKSCNFGGLSAASLCHPVGVTLDSNNNLYVADFDNNRELEYNTPLTATVIAGSGDTTADSVFGQDDSFTANACNLGGATASAETLCNPIRSAVDSSNNFYLADYSNHRVLKYNEGANPPSNNVANLELGQPDFLHSSPNIVDPSAFNNPENVAVDRLNHLYVSDMNNSRVLGFANASSFLNGASATIVIGQPDFFSLACNNGGVNAATLCNPAGVAVDNANNLYVSDYANHRVLIYFTPFTKTSIAGSGDSIADLVLGQGSNFFSNACNHGGAPNAETLCNPDGLKLDRAGNLWVADDSNHRVLEYYSPLFNTAANFVIGQADFFHNSCNRGGAVTASTLCNPAGVASDSTGNIYVADFNNNRVLVYKSPLFANGVPGSGDAVADLEFGQGNGSGTDFTHSTCNSTGVNANGLCNPNDVALDANNNLYVADFSNHRTLEYNSPLTTNTAADRAFGQADSLTSNACNFGGSGPSSASECHPTSVALDA